MLYKCGGLCFADSRSGRVEYDKLRGVYDAPGDIAGCERVDALEMRRRWPQIHVDETAFGVVTHYL